jgi:hypothetical protein
MTNILTAFFTAQSDVEVRFLVKNTAKEKKAFGKYKFLTNLFGNVM